MKRDLFKGKWYFAPFEHLLHDNRLWGIRRRNVVPAFAIGVFFAWMPFPGHPLMGALTALAFRVNIPVAALTTFVSNPLTMGPMYLLAHQLGQALLGADPQPFEFELSWQWVRDGFFNNWQPLMLGCVLLGAVTSLIAYIVLDVLWRAHIVEYLQKKRARRSD